MQKKVLVILCSTAAIMMIIGYGISYLMKPPEEELVRAEELIETSFYIKMDEKDNELFYKDLNEEELQNLIHTMSHQKVKADQKWGAILLTHERVGILINVVKENEDRWEHPELYLDILNRWYTGDFSQADEDHNAIWELQGGSVGKATGLLNSWEEKEFIQSFIK